MSRTHSTSFVRLVCMVLALCSAGVLTFHTSRTVSADSETQILRGLNSQGAYVSSDALRSGKAHAGDLARLRAGVHDEANRGVTEKLAILNTVHNGFRNSYDEAKFFHGLLHFSGVMVLVAGQSLGVYSDKLSTGELTTIMRDYAGTCAIQSYTECAIQAGDAAVSKIKDDQSSSNRNAAIFWIVVLVILAAIIGFVMWSVLRRRRAITGRLDDLRRAASNTLSLADDAVEEIESATAVKPMPADVQADYDRALGLRDGARTELERATTRELLTQANQDAAQSVLGLQGVMRRLGISSPLASPLDTLTHRCFYCGREDRPPYTKESITDDKGNSMEVEVCAVDEAQLQAGRKPKVATVNYQGTTVPWWAAPGNPWSYSYGGPTWQYWLPFFIGMDVGTWFGGGWGYGGGWDGGDAAPAQAADPGAAGDFGWGGDSSGSSADAGSFGDSGGWDGGGDSSGDFGGDGDWG